MKKIDILGKRNQDKMKQMADPDAVIERKIPKNKLADLPEDIYNADQSLVLDILKCNIADKSIGVFTVSRVQTEPMTACLKHLLREIDTKRQAYIYKDKHHNIYDPRYSITTARIVAMLANA